MDHLMLEDPLQGFQPIPAHDTADCDWAMVLIAETLK